MTDLARSPTCLSGLRYATLDTIMCTILPVIRVDLPEVIKSVKIRTHEKREI